MIRKKINQYLSREFGIGPHDMDIKFTAFGTRYRIPQFCILWNIIRGLQVAYFSICLYLIIVGLIIIGW